MSDIDITALIAELGRLAAETKGWTLNTCWPNEEDEGDWVIGYEDEDGERHPIIITDVVGYDAPGQGEVMANYLLAARRENIQALLQHIERLEKSRSKLLAALKAQDAADQAEEDFGDLCTRANEEGWDNDPTGSTHLTDASNHWHLMAKVASDMRRAALAEQGETK